MTVLERLGVAPGLAADDRMAVESVSALAWDRIVPRAAEFDCTAIFPWGNVHELNALGANAMFIPQAYGGAPVSYAAYRSCVLAVSRACAATGIVWATNFHAVKPLIDFGGKTLITNGDVADLYLVYGKWSGIEDPRAGI